MNDTFHVETELSNELPTNILTKKVETPLEKGRRRMAEMRALGIAPNRKPSATKTELLKAIKENCLQCEGEEDPCVRWRIANCLVPGCTLRPYRPFKHLEGTPLPEALNFSGKED